MPDAHFIGEEGSSQMFSPVGAFFIVDPIDGTTNFIRDYHVSCISVGLVVDGAAELGVVYNPYLDEMVTAQRGCGAFCHGNRPHVSSEPLAHADFQRAVDVRRSGSAALDLCAVAAGRADLFFELSLSPWDYAAGALIVKESGGLVSDINDRELAYDRQCSVVARNAVVQTIQLGT